MADEEILNQEFLKSIESQYIFDNAPINRFRKNKENDGTDKKLIDLKDKIKSIEGLILPHSGVLDVLIFFGFIGILFINILNGLFEFISLGSALLFLESLTNTSNIYSSFSFYYQLYCLE